MGLLLLARVRVTLLPAASWAGSATRARWASTAAAARAKPVHAPVPGSVGSSPDFGGKVLYSCLESLR
jgi:hypothetical protein